MDSEAKMDKYKLMAKGLRGRAVADLVATATREAGLYVFGDLFDVKSVKEVGFLFSHDLKARDSQQAQKPRTVSNMTVLLNI